MIKKLLPLLVLTLLLTGCDLEAAFKSRIDPIQNAYLKKVNGLQADIKKLAGQNDAGNDLGDNTDILAQVGSGVSLMQQVSDLQTTLFNNPNFLDTTPITGTDIVSVNAYVVGAIPETYYPAAPAPIRTTTYAMTLLAPAPGQENKMSALGMVQWLALAVSLPFTMMKALTATTTYLGPLGLLLSWVTMAGLWFLGITTLDFLVSLVRNSGGIIDLLLSVARLVK